MFSTEANRRETQIIVVVSGGVCKPRLYARETWTRLAPRSATLLLHILPLEFFEQYPNLQLQ
jgi:hypothetical protein